MNKVLQPFTLPVRGLKNGVHEYDFRIENDFFAAFEQSPITEGSFDVHLSFQKQDSLFEMTFDFSGNVKTECDRCLADIRLPFEGSEYLTVKVTLEENEEDAEIIYISPDVHELNVAKYLYEFICLSVPYHKVYDCQKEKTRPCDMVVLEKLNATLTDKMPDSEENNDNPLTDFFQGLQLPEN